MAGSYQHCIDSEGHLRSPKDLGDMIENLGDAFEAIEELYGMVHYMAYRLSSLAPVETRAQWIERAEHHYHEGLRMSGTPARGTG